jgi:hypothetical protein
MTNNYIMTAGTSCSSIGDKEKTAIGLACNHAYSILSAYSVNVNGVST